MQFTITVKKDKNGIYSAAVKKAEIFSEADTVSELLSSISEDLEMWVEEQEEE